MATKAEQQNFLSVIAPMAVADMAKTQILASLTIAQAIIESNWGLSGLTKVSNNLFGMKGSYNGQTVQYKTKEEYTVGTSTEIVDGFKVYPSWQASVDDHSALFHRLPRYHNLIGETDYKEACRKVKEDGYATSSTYTQTLINTIENYQLYKYDTLTPSSSNGMLFWRDNRVEYQYCVYGPTSGRSHNGIDVDTTSSDKRVLSTVAGKVVSSTIITDKNNLTWEWGNYVCVLDSAGRRHYFCHLASRSVSVGAVVMVGQEIGIMGMTGNAAYDKQAEHVHYEVRVSPYGSANHIDPTPFCRIPNAVGTTWNHKDGTPGQEWDTMLLKSFGTKNMQGFNFPDADKPVTYDKMPNGYRIVKERHITGTDGQGWEWVKLLDERTGLELYTPLLPDRNQLLADAPTLLPPAGDKDNTDAILTFQLALANSQHTTETILQGLNEMGAAK